MFEPRQQVEQEAPRGAATRRLPPAAASRLKRDRGKIEDALQTTLAAGTTRVEAAARRSVLAGGKRLRPLLTCAILRVLGHDPSAATEAIAAIELVHTGSLLHDDIIDGATMRRGAKAAHVAFDVPTAILAGDWLIARAAALVASHPCRELHPCLAATLVDLCRGESLERDRLFDATVDLDHARRVNDLKTASLFRYAAEAGALMADASPAARAAARTFGGALGNLFQLTDDLLDLTGDPGRLGKPIGQDLVAGIVTVPVALGLDRDPGLATQLRRLWDGGGPDGSADEQVAAIRSSLGRHQVLAATRELALAQRDRALDALSDLPPGPWTNHLTAMVGVLLERQA